jgi:hypothetical protein
LLFLIPQLRGKAGLSENSTNTQVLCVAFNISNALLAIEPKRGGRATRENLATHITPHKPSQKGILQFFLGWILRTPA